MPLFCLAANEFNLSMIWLKIYRMKNKKKHRGRLSMKYQCIVCGYIYDPEKGEPRSNIEPGTPFEDLPPKWRCPECGAGKFLFKPLK